MKNQIKVIAVNVYENGKKIENKTVSLLLSFKVPVHLAVPSYKSGAIRIKMDT